MGREKKVVVQISAKQLLLSQPETVMPQTATNLPSSGDATSFSSVEGQWVTHAQSFIERDNLNHDDIVAWAAFSASNEPQCDRLPCITIMLPIFQNKASTFLMIYHAMSII